ncbi:MAG: leucine-rich repeat protein [Alistipes sp.]|nr:leucine-rich repeat protein [Alistipes sp.]
MKKIFANLLLVAALFVAGCSDTFDDSSIWDKLEDHENRISSLEELCEQQNANISALKTLLFSVKNNDYVTGVTPVTQDGETIGYTISFSKLQPVTIYHGQNGQDGKDGSTPVIGVKKGDDAIYYWTLNGEWLLDEGGNKIKAEGTDGQDGQGGQDGQNGEKEEDGITPQLKIEDGYWHISYDNGATWQSLGKATGEDGQDGDSFFQSVTQDDNNVCLTLSDGTVIMLPKVSGLNILLDVEDVAVVPTNATIEIGYVVTGATDEVVVECLSSADIKAEVVSDNATTLSGKVVVQTADAIDKYSKVVLFVSDARRTIMKSLYFEETGLEVSPEVPADIDSFGGDVALAFLSNIECEVIVPDEAKEWISVPEATRALENQTALIRLTKNFKQERSATLTIRTKDGAKSIDYVVTQPEINVPGDELWYTTCDNKKITKANRLGATLDAKFAKTVLSHTYENGKGVVKFDGDVTRLLSSAFLGNATLETVALPNTIRSFADDVFSECPALKHIVLPDDLGTSSSGVTNYVTFAYIARYCPKLEGIYGNDNYTTEDNRCFVFYNKNSANYMLDVVAGAGLTEYTIPEHIAGVQNYAFSGAKEMTTVYIPGEKTNVNRTTFEGCDKLEAVYGPRTTSDHKGVKNGDTYVAFVARTGYDSHYEIPDDVTVVGRRAFEKSDFESISMGDQIVRIASYAFSDCPKLKSVTLSANLESIVWDNTTYSVEPAKQSNSSSIGRNPFYGSNALEAIYCRAELPPFYFDYQMTNFPNLKFYVPRQSFEAYKRNWGWRCFREFMQPYDYTDLPTQTQYISTDYSQDGVVTTIQKATEGNGIDVVLMGDGYTDQHIADGTYKQVMEAAAEKLFVEEPYKSYRHLFNVYAVNAVSPTESVSKSRTAFDSYLSGGTHVEGTNDHVIEYALKAVDETRIDNTMAIVMLNSTRRAGTCYMYFPESGDYGEGLSISYFPIGSDETQLTQVLNHEACGHGFAKLADEYAYASQGEIPASQKAVREQYEPYGWYKNIDFTSDPATIKWSKFLADERYAYDGLGVFEGGATYIKGVWRSTEDSMMYNNVEGFNAPSREAIYYRIHKLAYGQTWEYDYEKFVEYDAVNRKSAPETTQMSLPMVLREEEPFSPPVVVERSWRETRECR